MIIDCEKNEKKLFKLTIPYNMYNEFKQLEFVYKGNMKFKKKIHGVT